MFVSMEKVREVLKNQLEKHLGRFIVDAICNEIEKESAEPFKSSSFCDYCDFKNECQLKHPIVECDSFVGRKVVFVE